MVLAPVNKEKFGQYLYAPYEVGTLYPFLGSCLSTLLIFRKTDLASLCLSSLMTTAADVNSIKNDMRMSRDQKE